MDYRKYRAGFVEKLACAAVGAGAAGMAAWLFYRSVWGMLLFPAAYLVCVKKYCALQKEKRKEQLLMEFKDAMQSASAALLAGYSVENAVSASARDLERMYPEDADIVKEFHYMESQIKVSVPVEELFRSLGERCGIEDMENFAAVFYTAKRTGGDMSGIIQTSARMLGDKIDVKKEIETTLAAKKAEQMVMSLMPAGIILYLKLTSPGFLGVLYGNPFGIAAMTLCLGIYGFSYWLGRKIVDIEV